MCFHRSTCSLLSALLASLLMFAPHAHAQRCVAQGDGVTWGPCGGGGRSITIFIEREPQIILGKPQIVWVKPSAGASSQGDFSHITDPAIRMAMKDLSVTGWQQFSKAKKALEAGDLQLAQEHCDAARLRKNSADEQREIDQRCDWIGRALFDGREKTSGTLGVDKFKKTDSKWRALEIDFTDEQQKLMEMLFDSKRIEFEEYRQKILSRYRVRAEAEARAQQLGFMLKHPDKHPVTNTDTAQSRASAFEKAKADVQKADADVKQQLKEIEPLIIIRK
jgi:hypothetical protein